MSVPVGRPGDGFQEAMRRDRPVKFAREADGTTTHGFPSLRCPLPAAKLKSLQSIGRWGAKLEMQLIGTCIIECLQLTSADVLSQTQKARTGKQVARHFERTMRLLTPPDQPKNLLSLEISNTSVSDLIRPPKFALHYDWATKFAGRTAIGSAPGNLRYYNVGPRVYVV